MSNLKAYLKPFPSDRTKTVFLDRFTDEEGKKIPFVVKTIPCGENERITENCTDEKGKLRLAEYGDCMMVACMVEPNIKETEICEYYGVMDPKDVPGQMFTIGEKQIIQDAIMEINDVKKADDKIREAKNS